MGDEERSITVRAMLVQQNFDLLLSAQATAQEAMLRLLTSLAASNPEALAVVARIEVAMKRATEANTVLLEHLSDLPTCFETSLESESTRH